MYYVHNIATSTLSDILISIEQLALNILSRKMICYRLELNNSSSVIEEFKLHNNYVIGTLNMEDCSVLCNVTQLLLVQSDFSNQIPTNTISPHAPSSSNIIFM